ncbi:MAG: ion transporter [Planctomycetes bacterium]|nr:ion transporter [Planctomycetota bacterium]
MATSPNDERRTEQPAGLRARLHTALFDAETPLGNFVETVLPWTVVASVAVVMLDTVESVHARWRGELRVAELGFTALFTLEYLARLWCSREPRRYATSLLGAVDLLAVLPTYVLLFTAGIAQGDSIRMLRLMRVFRVLKMAQHVGEANVLLGALIASRHKIFAFLTSVLALVCIEGTLMYVIESGSNPGITSIPEAIYWSIVTVTTVGYGDVVPVTVMGRLLASCIMMTAFTLLAVPTAIVTGEIARHVVRERRSGRACVRCAHEPAELDARFCTRCGELLCEATPRGPTRRGP